MDSEPGWYVEFASSPGPAYDRLVLVVNELRADKERGTLSADNEQRWRAYFTPEELARFWWPTPEESADWLRRWDSTPVDRRHQDPTLKTPWHFASMLEGIGNAEMRILGVARTAPDRARLVFEPYAGPHGSFGPLTALVEAFGFRVTTTEGS